MDDLIGLIVNDESPSEVSDKIKEILQIKAMEKINAIRPELSSSLFNGVFSNEEE